MTADEFEALKQLEAFLAPSIAQAQRGEFYEGTMEDILAEAHKNRRKAN